MTDPYGRVLISPPVVRDEIPRWFPDQPRHALRPSQGSGPSEPTVDTPTPASGALSPQERAAEIERLTAVLHANCCHPDWIYLYTVGAVSNPPSTIHGTGWTENPGDPRHGAGTEPTKTWSWRRPKTAEETT